MSARQRRLRFLNRPPMRRDTLKADFIAGLTVALLAIPQSLAYAQLAGVPLQYGLYAAVIPSVVGAIFGASRLLSTGPVAMTALLTGASVSQLAAVGSEQYYLYVILLALISGVFQVAFGVVRMGVLLNFVSYPVLMGFINAAALIIALSQVPALLGIVPAHSPIFLLDVWQTFGNLNATHELSIVFGVIAILLLLAFRKYAPRLPGMLITVALLTTASYLVGYENRNGPIVGEVPQGLPQLSIPPLDWNLTLMLLPAGFVIALVSFMEAMSSCKVISLKTRTPWDENQELIGQGLAKIAGAFSQCLPVSGSFSRTALNLAAGAKSGMSSVFSAIFVLITLLFFTPLLYHLPQSVLAAIILVALLNLFDCQGIVRAWRTSIDDGLAAVITFLVTLAFAPNIQIGILTGIMLSLALLMYRLMRPRVAVLGLHEDGVLRDARGWNLPELHPQLGALRFDGSLIFVNVAYFEDAILQLEQQYPRLKYILVAAGGINTVDASGIEVLARLVERLKTNGITLTFSGIKQQVLKVMEKARFTEVIGTDNIFPTDVVGLNTLLRRLGPLRDDA